MATKDKSELEGLLGDIHSVLLKDFLEEKKKKKKRTPQLYNAVIKELERNGIDCVPKAGDESGNTLRAILDNVKEDLGDSVYFTGTASSIRA